MPRRLNYTNRKKISREDVSIQLKNSPAGLIFDADLRLADYNLEKVIPPPRIYVEAYRGASTLWKRFDFGRFGTMQPPDDRSLEEFAVPEGILFRVKVSATADDALGRLLAEADTIRPRLPDEQEAQGLPLIQYVPSDDIGDEVWRVTDFDGTLPLLKINSRVEMGFDQFLRNHQHRATMMPAVMRQILTRILVIDRGDYDEDDTASWQARWLNFSSRLPNVGQRPEVDEDGKRLKNSEELEKWIDDAVEAFASSRGLFTAFTQTPDHQP